MKLDWRSVLVGLGTVLGAAFTAWVHAGEPLTRGALVPVLVAAFGAVSALLPAAVKAAE